MSEETTLTLEISFAKANHVVTVPLDSTVKALKDAIHDKTQVPPAVQKLVIKGFKGNLKDDAEIVRNLGIKNNSKAILIGSTLEKIIAVTAPDTAPKKKQVEPDTPPTPLVSQAKEHKKAIDKGLPTDAEPAVKNTQVPLPKMIKGLLNKRGDPIRLTFKPESRELWIATKEATDKLSFSQIRDIVSEPIHTNTDYHMMGFQTGTNVNSMLWVYFVPVQYVKSIKYSILGLASFPFLQNEH